MNFHGDRLFAGVNCRDKLSQMARVIIFLVTCNIYSILRNDFLNSVGEKLKVESMVRTDKIVMLKYLLGNIEISPLVAKYITKTMELRNFLMNNPKRLTWYSITVTLLSYWWKSACPYCYFSVVSCGYLCHFFYGGIVVVFIFPYFVNKYQCNFCYTVLQRYIKSNHIREKEICL